MREFAAEHYLAGPDAAGADHGASAARVAAEQLAREGTPVEFARSIVIPDDEIWGWCVVVGG